MACARGITFSAESGFVENFGEIVSNSDSSNEDEDCDGLTLGIPIHRKSSDASLIDNAKVNEELRCRSCEESYDSERIPRILDCGHCLCTNCVEYTILNKKECPVCHSISVAESVSAFPVDDNVLNLFSGYTANSSKETRAEVSSETLQGKSIARQWSEINFPERRRDIAIEEQKTRSLSEGERDRDIQERITYSLEYRSTEYPVEEVDVRIDKERVTWGLGVKTKIVDLHKETTVPSNEMGEYAVTSVDEGYETIDYKEQRNFANITDDSNEPRNLMSFEELGASADPRSRSRYSPDINKVSNIAEERNSTAICQQCKDNCSFGNSVIQRYTSAEAAIDLFQDATELVGMCATHELPFSFMCITCNIWGCQSCSGSDHQDNPFNKCIVLNPKQAIQALKVTYKDKAVACMKNMKKIKKIVEREVSGVKVIANYYEKEASRVRAELEVIENNLKELKILSDKALKTKTEVRTIAGKLRNAYDETSESNTDSNVISAMEVLESCKNSLNKYRTTEVQRVPVIPNMRIRRKKDVLGLLEVGAPVYGVQGRNEGDKWSQLTLQDGHILLHCLRDDVYPNEGIALFTLQFELLRQMVPVNSPTLFLDIGWGGRRRGRVYVRMLEDTSRGRQALYLCSGERGPSYRNTVFFDRKEYSSWTSTVTQEILHGGDYEYNNGSGGRAIMEDISNGGEYNHPAIDGMMASWPAHEDWRLGSFFFYVRGNPSKSIDTGFGIVTDGLEILRAAAKQVPIYSSYICDCGLVIPL